jgi:hypothetical protein
LGSIHTFACMPTRLPSQALHAELEPGYPAESPGVAVVGISNWALDAAKVNRAVLLSR